MIEVNIKLVFLQCPQCGSSFPEHGNEVPTEDSLDLKYKKSKSQIISANSKKRKFYDKHGNPINDPDLFQDILQGKTVISYREDKVEEKRHHIIRKI